MTLCMATEEPSTEEMDSEREAEGACGPARRERLELRVREPASLYSEAEPTLEGELKEKSNEDSESDS